MIIAGKILIERKVGQTETKSGILLPESMTTEENIGTVLHVGAATKDMTPEVKPGDTVVFNHKTHRRKDFVLEDRNVVEVGFEDIYLIHKN
jgi:co-chaperonin GroES (HSP10)